MFARFTRSPVVTQINEEYKEADEERKTIDVPFSPKLLSRTDSGILFGPELEHRLDFELREGLVESRYWSAVTSHTSYWSSLDVALFLLSFLYTQRPGNERNTETS